MTRSFPRFRFGLFDRTSHALLFIILIISRRRPRHRSRRRRPRRCRRFRRRRRPRNFCNTGYENYRNTFVVNRCSKALYIFFR